MAKWFKHNWQLIVVLIIATSLRFYKLASLPPGLHPDEAANGLDIISMIEKGRFAAIYDTNGPREALFLYLQGIFVWLGNLLNITAINYTPLSLRIAPAIIGVITVWAIYLLGKEMYNKNVGLFAATALAVSAWHIQFSRNGFRAIMAPLALIFLFYFFIKAYREGKLKYYLATGITLALGCYTYLSFRMAPLVLFALLIFILFKDKKFISKYWKNISWMGVAFLIVMIPMFIHFYNVPEDIAGRSSTSIFNQDLNGGNPAMTFINGVQKTALMLNVHGDENFRHNLGGWPMLDPIVGILFWVGVVLVIFKINKIENFLLLMWAGALSLPELLTAEGIPHALRIVGIIPVVFICVGIAVNWLIVKLKAEKYTTYIFIGLLAVSSVFGYYKYFMVFPTMVEAGEAYSEDMVSIANDINSASPNRNNILIVGEYGTKTVEFITHSTQHKWKRFEPRDADQIVLAQSNNKIFVTKSWLYETQAKLKENGFNTYFQPVFSKIDRKTVLYYEYQN
ncbi:MAG: glycosyltransferase family 39 protein [bacterium]